MKNFIMVGAAGYIAPKHLEAIKKTKNNLLAAYDIAENVGIIDSFFQNSKFFFKFNEFDKFVSKNKNIIDYLVICAPNYLHFFYIKLGIKYNLNVICEKPLVLKINDIKKLKSLKKNYTKKIYCILQLRLNKNLQKIQRKIKNKKNIVAKVNYITFRGDWFFKSWKGSTYKSGGIAINIGIHLFDLLLWFFGDPKKILVYKRDSKSISGKIQFKRNNIVSWMISLKKQDLKKFKTNNNFYRLLELDNKKIEFSDKFRDLHYESYKMILKNKGFTIFDAEPSLKVCSQINKIKI
jgi:UDP-N-acetyl-2-amino-2-deoxyglucuronate dehydrogenase